MQQFQEDRGLGVNGIVNAATFQELFTPLLQVLASIIAGNQAAIPQVVGGRFNHIAETRRILQKEGLP